MSKIYVIEEYFGRGSDGSKSRYVLDSVHVERAFELVLADREAQLEELYVDLADNIGRIKAGLVWSSVSSGAYCDEDGSIIRGNYQNMKNGKGWVSDGEEELTAFGTSKEAAMIVFIEAQMHENFLLTDEWD